MWLFVEDFAKRLVYDHLDASGPHHRRFLDMARRSLHGANQGLQG